MQPPWQGSQGARYLGCGDHEGPQGAVGPQSLHGRHVLIRGPRRRIHEQKIQGAPGHVSHELFYKGWEPRRSVRGPQCPPLPLAESWDPLS